MSKPIFLTVLLYIHSGEEKTFVDYESKVLPLLDPHGGRLEKRLRISDQAEAEKPFEVHLIQFPSEDAFQAFQEDPIRKQWTSLGERAIRRVVIWKGWEI